MTAAAATVVPGCLSLPRPRAAELRQRGHARLRCQPVRCGPRRSPDFPGGNRVDNPGSSASSSECHSAAADGNSSLASSCGRRRIFLLATAPLLLPSQGSSEQRSNANAAAEEVESSWVRSEVRKVVTKSKAPGMLRLAFHDAGTFDINDGRGGMNGSVVLELDRPENAGLNKSVKVLGKAKSELDKVLDVSWADLIAVAGAEAVSVCGGPSIPVQLGRMDASAADPEGKLPEETLGAVDLKKRFSEKGFSTQELVALAGAHTLGGKGFGSPLVFDNAYFKILLDRPWAAFSGGAGPSSMSGMIGLPSDRALAEDEECLRWISVYAADQGRFFEDFTRAYLKMVNTGATWRTA